MTFEEWQKQVSKLPSWGNDAQITDDEEGTSDRRNREVAADLSDDDN